MSTLRPFCFNKVQLRIFARKPPPETDSRSGLTINTRAELLWTVVLGIVLVGSAFCLVDLHFQMRQLFVAHEHEMDVHRRLLDDQAELEMKVRRASLPGSISAGAAMLDLSGATGADTVTLVEAPDGRIDFLPEVRRELDALTTNGDAQKSKADPKNAQPSVRGAGAGGRS